MRRLHQRPATAVDASPQIRGDQRGAVAEPHGGEHPVQRSHGAVSQTDRERPGQQRPQRKQQGLAPEQARPWPCRATLTLLRECVAGIGGRCSRNEEGGCAKPSISSPHEQWHSAASTADALTRQTSRHGPGQGRIGNARHSSFVQPLAHRAGRHRSSPRPCFILARSAPAAARRLASSGCTFTVTALVLSVHCRASHAFSKEPVSSIELVQGHGVVGDAHFGSTIKHRSRVAKDPTQPNLRQVHLLHQELLDELAAKGLSVAPGQLGENITTSGLPLLSLSEGTVLRIGSQAVVRITGLRNPCAQIENFKPGLLHAVLDRTPGGELVRKAGVMGVVVASGFVWPGDPIEAVAAPVTLSPLKPV